MKRALPCLVAILAACSGSEDGAATPPAVAPPAEAVPGGSSGAPPPASPCPRLAKADDHARKVVVSHPFLDGGGKANAYELLELSVGGQLAKTGKTFTMRRSMTEIVFTPDGQIGMVAQEDGSVGVFSFDAAGAPVVLQEGFAGDFSAGHLVMAKDGQRVYILDPNTESNGGGLFEAKIACDGTLSAAKLVVPGGQAHAMALLPGDPSRAVYVAGKALDSPAGSYAHVLDLAGGAPKRVVSGAVFDDADALASSVAVTLDGKFALVTDNGFAKGSRMAAVSLADATKRATIDTPNPAGVVMSPFGNAMLLMNSDGEDALRVVKYDAANDATPLSIAGLVALKGGKTELPTIAFAIDRGSLKGRVLVSENQAVRQLAFGADGSLTDVDARVDFTGFTGIVGALGIEP